MDSYSEEFRTKYDRPAPAGRKIRKWKDEYEARGSHMHHGGNSRPTIGEEKKKEIEELLKQNPKMSLRQIKAETGASVSTVWRFIRKELGLFPYRLQMTTELSGQDMQRRISFAEYCREQLSNDSKFLQRMIFSDECQFSLSGGVNKQNCHIWGSERPNEVYEVPQSAPSVMVWCAISTKEIIEPYFFDNENVTGETYKKCCDISSFLSFGTTLMI